MKKEFEFEVLGYRVQGRVSFHLSLGLYANVTATFTPEHMVVDVLVQYVRVVVEADRIEN